MTLEQMRARLAELRGEILALSDATAETWTALEGETRSALEARGEYALLEFTTLKADLDAAEARARRVAEVRATVTEETPGADVNVIRSTDPLAGSIRGASRSELRDRAMKVLETRGKRLAPFQQDHVASLLDTRSIDVDGSHIAKLMLATESDAYRSAFQKGVTGDSFFTAEEQAAVLEFRAASEGTPSAGGFGIPVLIDPTIILTSGAVDAPILQLATVKTITTDAWKGVSSAGVTWSYDAEASAVSDDTPTLAQPVINVFAARGFIPYSIEVGQDYPGFADEMAMLLSQGFVDLVASQSMVGSGSSSPRGLFTAVAATTTNPAHVTVATAGTIGAVDVRSAWAALPERYRGRATWLMSPTVDAKIRALGNNLNIADFTVDLTKDGTPVLTGRPVVVSDYATAFSGTTGAANYAVIGDVSQFFIVQRAGMTVELVDHLFDQATGRPSGSRGWFAYARHGMDVANANAFRLLSNS
jgi:HK97 family phage major capsid protein